MRVSGILVAGLVVVVSAGDASAQRSRYPREPVDRDQEAANRSSLWEAAANPQRSGYEVLVGEAAQLLEDRSGTHAAAAVAKLDRALGLYAHDVKAYRLRGDARVMLKDWAGCATDYQSALDRMKTADVEVRSSAEMRRKLGACFAHGGRFADAERVLGEAAAAGGPGSGESWLRLGEVRIALGKLEEAVGALEAARDSLEVPPAPVRLMLAGAYDRARRPSDALAAVLDAVARDNELMSIRNPALNLLGAGEVDYLLGLASSLRDPARPEHALIYFRRYLAQAPNSPWRKRVEEHLRALRAASLPETFERLNATNAALLDPSAARPIVRRYLGDLRACLIKHPTVLLKIELTKLGPRTQGPGRRSYAPPEGATILVDENLDKVAKAELDQVVRCAEPHAEKLLAALPTIKDKDAWYRARLLVAAP
jgi:tetratricopeptide (TPR) repeat protein